MIYVGQPEARSVAGPAQHGHELADPRCGGRRQPADELLDTSQATSSRVAGSRLPSGGSGIGAPPSMAIEAFGAVRPKATPPAGLQRIATAMWSAAIVATSRSISVAGG